MSLAQPRRAAPKAWGLLAGLTLTAGAVHAGAAPEAVDATQGAAALAEVLVQAGPQPDRVVGPDELRYVFAASGEDIKKLLEPQGRSTRSGRSPMYLVNMRPAATEEWRNIPADAIERIEEYDEDKALQLGFGGDRRLINVVTRKGYRGGALTASEQGTAHADGLKGEASASAIAIGNDLRRSANASVSHQSGVSDGQRDLLIDSASLRTLVPQNQVAKAAGTLAGLIGDVAASLGVSADTASTRSLLGPAAASGPGALTPLSQDLGNTGAHVEAALMGNWRGLDWDATGSFDHLRTTTRSDIGVDAAGSLIAQNARFGVDRGSLDADGLKETFDLPAGPVLIYGEAVVKYERVDSALQTPGAAAVASLLSREDYHETLLMEFPLANAAATPNAHLGTLDLDLYHEWNQVSGFGTLQGFGYQLTWSPVMGLAFNGGVSQDRVAPTAPQLLGPVVITPNVQQFDYVTGQTVFVTRIDGGNDGLRASTNHRIALGLRWTVDRFATDFADVRFERVRTTDPIALLPPATPAVELAFPQRFVRSPAGALVQTDDRWLNLQGRDTDHVALHAAGSWKFSGGALHWWLSDWWILRDRIRLAAPAPVLDLLGGAPTMGGPVDTGLGTAGADASAPTLGAAEPRHHVQAYASYSVGRLALSLQADYQSASLVYTGGTGAIGGIAFSARLTLDLALRVQLGQVFAGQPWLRGTEAALQIGNLFASVPVARSVAGADIAAFQPAFLDPLGRTVKLTLRKSFPGS